MSESNCKVGGSLRQKYIVVDSIGNHLRVASTHLCRLHRSCAYGPSCWDSCTPSIPIILQLNRFANHRGRGVAIRSWKLN